MTVGTSQALTFQIRLMAREAAKRSADSATLGSNIAGAGSDSAYLLELLAFELLLKATLQIHGVKPPAIYSYSRLFGLLPPGVQRALRDTAASRVGPDVDFSKLDRLLDTWGQNFVRLRYPYEKYEGLTGEQYRARGDMWLQNGAEEDAADFVYYPEQLHAFTHALQIEVDTWLSGR